MGHNLIVMEGQPMKPKKSQQSQQSKQSQQQSRGGKMQRGERPVLTGRIQSREEVDGKVEYRDVGRLGLWTNTKKKSDKSPSLTGRVTFSSTSTEYGVSVWGDIPYVSDGGDAPF
jgi:hypothetical protein